MNQDLGTKRTCSSCSTKFYDFNADTVSCPKCGHVFELKVVKSDSPKPSKKAKPKKDIGEGSDTEVIEEFEGVSAVAELEELDDYDDDLEHLEEVEDHHEDPEVDMNSDDADDEMFIDELPENGLHLVDDLDDLDEDRDAM